MLIDTHCHLFLEEFDADREGVVERAKEAGVQKILLPNIDCSTIERLYSTEKSFPDLCYAMIGLHPTSVKENFQDELKEIEKKLVQRKFTGIGEIGMDLYWDKIFIKEQKIAFQTQLEWAVKYNYPVSIHCRDAFDVIFEILDAMQQIPKGVFHCFTGTYEQAQKILSYQKFKLGIGGVITFKKSHLPEVLKKLDLIHFVLETDAPYLSPVPFRGKRNEPAYLKHIVQTLADIKDSPVEEVIKHCYQNTVQVFFHQS